MLGCQTPRIQIEPNRVSTDGEAASLLMSAYGYELDEWQKLVVNAWLGKDENGSYTMTSGGLSVPRQNGKNFCISCRELYGLVVNGERILHTAHQTRTAKDSFEFLANIFEDTRHPDIRALVKKIKYGTGEEQIELKNGGTIRFLSRSRQAARGFNAISLVVLDEAQELEQGQIQALMAILSASKTGYRQLLYCGTPPYEGADGSVFRNLRESCLGIAERKEHIKNCWHEWSIDAENLAEVDLSDRKLWYQTNPALGGRLSESFTQSEFETLDALGFAQERLGYWSVIKTEEQVFAIPDDLWMSCASMEPKPNGKTAFGVKFSADGASVVLAGAVVTKDGQERISLIGVAPTGRGVSWLADFLNERYKTASCVVIDGRNGSDLLIDKISHVWRFKDSVIKATPATVIASATMLLNELNELNLTWYAQQEELKDSALSCIKRPISGGWGFGGANSAPLEACSLALWGAMTSKRDPSRVMRIG